MLLLQISLVKSHPLCFTPADFCGECVAGDVALLTLRCLQLITAFLERCFPACLFMRTRGIFVTDTCALQLTVALVSA